MSTIPSRQEAERLFAWAVQQNPEPWAQHCKIVATAAEAIAAKSGLDADRAYISGLFHDIGYHGYENGRGRSSHLFLGYELLMKNGYEALAGICLSHSFPYQDIREYFGKDLTYCSEEEMAALATFLTKTVYDDYDKLIQLCDCLGTAQGICTLEKRMVNVVMRHGFNNLTTKKWEATFALKDYFDKKCGEDIYNLFRDEIIESIFEKTSY